jgi:hypothetical protein
VGLVEGVRGASGWLLLVVVISCSLDFPGGRRGPARAAGVVGEEHVEGVVLQPGPAVAAGVVGDLQRDQPGDQRPEHVQGPLPGHAGGLHVGAGAGQGGGRDPAGILGRELMP